MSDREYFDAIKERENRADYERRERPHAEEVAKLKAERDEVREAARKFAFLILASSDSRVGALLQDEQGRRLLVSIGMEHWIMPDTETP